MSCQYCFIFAPVATRTYSTAIRSSCNGVVLKLEVLVEDVCVKLDSSVEAIAYSVPIGSGFGGHVVLPS